MHILPSRCHRWFLSLGLALALGWPNPMLAAPANQPAEAASAAPAAMRISGVQAAATNLEEAERAVVQIEAVGAFVDPKEGAQAGGWGGSGFIIDPSGIAVTNNHVVTGAAYLKVYLPGETKPRHAKVLGVDECADLAVIDIDGDHFPYLAWSDTALKVGTPVYASGYPLGDPEYTLTSGIISKAQANGQTSWASLPYVLQHGASLNPGNSGGPLLDNAWQVVGINYASNHDANQYFAISGELARPLIEQLRTGIDLDTIGINGEAMSDGKTYAGVWVYSVRSGSPADKTGVQPGDFITKMEGVLVGVGASMERYCDIVRGHRPNDVIAIELLRNQGELWVGQLNGRSLSYIENRATPAPTEAAAAAYTYVEVSNDVIHAVLPKEWNDAEIGDWVDKDQKQIIGHTFVAAPDLKGFQTEWSASGVKFFVKTGIQGAIDINQQLDAMDLAETCKKGKRQEHSHTIQGHTYVGAYDIWTNCADAKNVFVRLVAVSQPDGQLIIIQFNGTTGADPEAWQKLRESFYVEGNAPATPTPAPAPRPAKPCVRFDNHFNKVADVTLTMPGNPNSSPAFFKIAPHGRNTQCLAPGRYTFSVGVPGEDGINGEFTLQKGGRIQIIPIYKQFS